MGKLEVIDVKLENVDDLVSLCVPPDKKDDPYFVEGMNAKRRWATKALEKYGSIAKLAYLNSKPVGLLQYLPNSEERLVDITCIFVPARENLRKGIGKNLLKALIEDVKTKPTFNKDLYARALVTFAFEVPGWFPQHKFYRRMGFKEANGDDRFLLYYPIEEGYVHVSKEKNFVPQEEDKGKAIVFFDPSCPFSFLFSEKMKESMREVAPNIPISVIDIFWQQEETKKRGQVPSCVVNGKPITSFFMDQKNFQKEVKKAIICT